MNKNIVEKTTQLRHQLHQIPELAFKEVKTKKTLINFLQNNTSLEIVDKDLWFYAVWKGTNSSLPAIAFRADFDAVQGADGKAYHRCGHDGHSSILAGFGIYLSEVKPERTIYLIFQPAEEIGKGGEICSKLLKEKNISRIYGFHNIPGYETGKILTLYHTFACASTGMEIVLKGKASHAAYPEAGKNPATLIAQLILYMNELISKPHKAMVLGTVIGIEAGGTAYGVSASNGILRVLLRAAIQDEFVNLVNTLKNKAETEAEKNGFECFINMVEPFPATENYADCVEQVRQCALKAGCQVEEPSEPFRWSEDFAYYLMETKGAFFGVGSGIDHPQLHTPEYEFPDEIIETVQNVYSELIK